MSPSIDTRETRASAYEIKFVIPSALGETIAAWARQRLLPDPHATGHSQDEYRTTTLYCDTEAFDVFHKIESYGRSKYRIRRYGNASEVFLERKMRSVSVLTKRRTAMDLAALAELGTGESGPGAAGHWFRRRLRVRGLRPVCQLSYERMARVAMAPLGPIRLTLDQDLRAQRASGFQFVHDTGRAVLDRRMILELKYRVALPAIFKHLVEEFRLTPVALSKYRLGLTTLGHATSQPGAAVPAALITPDASSGSTQSWRL